MKPVTLSERKEILYFVSIGFSQEQIAEELDIKVPRVEYIVREMKREYRAFNCAHLVGIGLRHGIIE